jgi:hypothetical protein
MRLSPLSMSASNRPIVHQPRMIIGVEHSVEWEFIGETEVFGENLASTTSSSINPWWTELGPNPDRRGGKPVTNRLIYGPAKLQYTEEASNIALSCENIHYTDSSTEPVKRIKSV